MSLLEGKKISRSFGGIEALLRVDFWVEEGEIVGLIGPNGAGKTTLFNVITGTYPPTSGAIFFEGQPITGMKPDRICRMGIARTYQLVRTFAGLSVLENVLVGGFFGSKSGRKSDSGAVEDALTWLDFLGIGQYVDRPVEGLTMAMRKKVEVARALATHPKLLLLDEVMAGLTPTEIEDMIHVVREIQQRGVTVVIIEHHMQAVMNLSNRIIAIHYGQKIAQGTPEVVAGNQKVIEAYLGE
jgi:branched-chain amino acid transport system ATP-binding protein